MNFGVTLLVFYGFLLCANVQTTISEKAKFLSLSYILKDYRNLTKICFSL